MTRQKRKATSCRTMAVFAAALLQACVASAPRQNTGEERPLAPMTMAEKVSLRQIEDVGRMIYERDIVAAYASDLLLKKIDPRDYPDFVGWVTYPGEKGYTVSFYEQSGQSVGLVADVSFDRSGSAALTVEPDRLPSKAEISMVRARIAALRHGRSSCSDKHNTVVVPVSGRWDVYVLAATAEPDVVQAGGHVRVSVSAEGGEVLDVTPLSESCLAMNKSPNDLPQGAEVAMLTMSHVVGELPSPVHVYLNLLHKIPLGVVTGRGVWIIDDGNIGLRHGKGGGKAPAAISGTPGAGG